MAELPEVAIEAALLERATAFAAAQSLPLSVPNVDFKPPLAKTGNVFGKYLRASFLPAPSTETGISFRSHVQHQGILQIDCFVGVGAGELVPGRIASAAILFFARGSQFPKDNIVVRVDQAPRRGPLIVQDAWAQIPVSVAYQCFARPA